MDFKALAEKWKMTDMKLDLLKDEEKIIEAFARGVLMGAETEREKKDAS